MTRRPSSVEAQLRSLSSVLHPPSPFLPFPLFLPSVSVSPSSVANRIAPASPSSLPAHFGEEREDCVVVVDLFREFWRCGVWKELALECVCLEWDGFVESTSGIFVVVPGLVVCFGDEL